jgi:hypothetical protein
MSGNVNPLFAESNRLFALSAIQSVRTVSTVYRHIDDLSVRPLQGRAKLIKILRIGGWEVTSPGLDFVYVELFNDMGSEVFEVDGVGRLALFSGDDPAKGIRSDGDAIASGTRKLYVRS